MVMPNTCTAMTVQKVTCSCIAYQSMATLTGLTTRPNFKI